MALTQSERQHYLEQMGIQLYVPRHQLAGAKVVADTLHKEEELQTVLLNVPPMDVTETVIIEPAPKVETQPSAASDINLILKPAVSIVVDEELEVRFQFELLRLTSSICVLSQVPHAVSHQGLPGPNRALLANICSAMKLDVNPESFSIIGSFRWPFIEGGVLGSGEQAAKIALGAYLQEQQRTLGFTSLIAMGVMAADYAGVKEGNKPWQLISIRSLDEMLKVWQFKREAWLQLSHLHSSPLH